MKNVLFVSVVGITVTVEPQCIARGGEPSLVLRSLCNG